MLNGLDLFSGIGGLTLALSPWVRPVAYCENDRYATAVLLSRMCQGIIQQAPIWDDIRTLRGDMLPIIDIIVGGFPCQDVSIAGVRKGLDGKRSGLFYELVRLTKEIAPSFVFLENVAAIKNFVPRIRADLERLGYSCRDGFLSALDVGAPHPRERWFLLAHSNSLGRGLQQEPKQQKQARKFNNVSSTAVWQDVKPPFCGVDYGFPARVDRIRGLGNAVVPQCAREAFMRLSGLSLEHQN